VARLSLRLRKVRFQVTGAFAEFEHSMIRQRVNAGLKRAVEQGKHIRRHLEAGKGILKVARECKVGTGTVQRIAKEMAGERPFRRRCGVRRRGQ
jgi:DNA invertase Pin-like site-specific DNA recombinase